MVNRLSESGEQRIAIAVDARTGKDIVTVPQIIHTLRSQGMDVRVVFLEAETDTLVTRYSESRRRHPLSTRLGAQATVAECVEAEREMVQSIRPLADVIDTTELLANTLRRWVLQSVEETLGGLTVVFETFGFKKGLPKDADLVFDVRCLSNPHYDRTLRPMTGKDEAVQNFLLEDERTTDLMHDIEQYLRRWLPSYRDEQRSYVTVAIGCTGGQHRSVFVAETLAQRFKAMPLAQIESILLRHRTID